MVYGKPASEGSATKRPFGEVRLAETITPKRPHREKVQELIFQEKYGEADQLVNILRRASWHALSNGRELIVAFRWTQTYQNFYRELDIVRRLLPAYTVNGVTFTQGVLLFADDVIIMRLGRQKGVSPSTFRTDLLSTASPTVENVLYWGKGGDHEGIPGVIEYEIQTAVKQAGEMYW